MDWCCRLFAEYTSLWQSDLAHPSRNELDSPTTSVNEMRQSGQEKQTSSELDWHYLRLHIAAYSYQILVKTGKVILALRAKPELNWTVKVQQVLTDGAGDH